MPMTTMIARALAALMLMLLPSALFAADDWPLPRGEPTSLGLTPDGLRRIADTLNADIEKGKIPGAVLLIARHGKIGWVCLDSSCEVGGNRGVVDGDHLERF